MLHNESLVAMIGFDTAENWPRQVCCMIGARELWFGIFSALGVHEVTVSKAVTAVPGLPDEAKLQERPKKKKKKKKKKKVVEEPEPIEWSSSQIRKGAPEFSEIFFSKFVPIDDHTWSAVRKNNYLQCPKARRHYGKVA